MSDDTGMAWRRRPEELTSDIYAVLPWIEQHLGRANGCSPWSQVQPGDISASLPASPPNTPDSLDDIMSDLSNIIAPGLVRWDAPGWMAWFPSNAHPDSILGDLLSTVMAQQGMLWMSSPACTELEMRMLDWLRQAMGLPECFAESGQGGGVIQDTASSAVLACLVAAREQCTGGQINRDGPEAAAGLVAYCSDQAHSSMAKAVGIAGIGRRNLRVIPTDDRYRLDAIALRDAMDRDAHNGLRPFFCVATVGTTGCGAIDPVEEIATVCSSHHVWLHVDAAWAGTASLSKSQRPAIIAGAKHAQSWCFNPHKWMGAAFDCSCLWIARRRDLTSAMSIDPEYLRNVATDDGDVTDYRDWHVQLGRRFRAMKLWVLLRRTGVRALADMIDFHIELAKRLETAIASHQLLCLAAPRSLSLLCVKHVDGDEATQRVLDVINTSERFAVTHCRLGDSLVIRFAIGALATDTSDIDEIINTLSTC